jgi:hypothetical protein
LAKAFISGNKVFQLGVLLDSGVNKINFSLSINGLVSISSLK